MIFIFLLILDFTLLCLLSLTIHADLLIPFFEGAIHAENLSTNFDNWVQLLCSFVKKYSCCVSCS